MNDTREILNIDEAAELLGVSVKTFNKVLHTEHIPGRKIGREWKFSRRALIDWVGSGRSQDFYEGTNGFAAEEHEPQREPLREIVPHAAAAQRDPVMTGHAAHAGDKTRARRTAGWQIELD